MAIKDCNANITQQLYITKKLKGIKTDHDIKGNAFAFPLK